MCVRASIHYMYVCAYKVNLYVATFVTYSDNDFNFLWWIVCSLFARPTHLSGGEVNAGSSESGR